MVRITRRRTPLSMARIFFATALLSLAAGASQGVVTLVEAGHSLSQIVDSAVPLHPSQAALDSACAFGNAGNVESVGVDAATGTLYIQISSGGFASADTCIFAVSPSGVATSRFSPLSISTGAT